MSTKGTPGRSELARALARVLVEDLRRPLDRAVPPGATPEHGAAVVGHLHPSGPAEAEREGVPEARARRRRRGG